MKVEPNLRKTNRIVLLITAFVFIILTVQQAYSLGISPSEQIFEYIPGKTEKSSITIQNTLGFEINVELTTSDTLGNSVTFPEGNMVKVPAASKVSVPITLTLPEEDTVYGKVCAIVWAKRLPKSSSGISATERVGAKFCTEIPYPGKYLELQVSPRSINVGTPSTTVLLTYTSKGKEIINSIKSTVYLLNKNGSIIRQYPVNEVKDLFTGAQETVTVNIETGDLIGGDYIIKAVTRYDEKTITKNATLVVGYPDIDINSYTKNIAVNFADEFSINLKNKYLDDFKVVYAEIIIYTPDGKELTYSTAPITLNAGSSGSLKTVVPTKNLDVGEYPVKIILHFDGKTKEVDGEILVTEKTQPQKTTQTPISGFSVKLIITTVILTNALILVLLIVLIKRNHKIKEDEL